jgi:hypothetical protein
MGAGDEPESAATGGKVIQRRVKPAVAIMAATMTSSNRLAILMALLLLPAGLSPARVIGVV